MTEEFIPRKRDVGPSEVFSSFKRSRPSLSLAELLVVLSSTSYQPSVSIINDPLSISIRAMLMCELAIKDRLFVNSEKEVECLEGHASLDPLHDEMYSKIKNSKKRPVDKWLMLLNGETFSLKTDKYSIKKVRKRVREMLISKNILEKPKQKRFEAIQNIFSKAQPQRMGKTSTKNAKTEIIKETSDFLLNNAPYVEEDRLYFSAFICALFFCDLMEDVLMTLSPASSDQALRRAQELVERFKTGMLANTSRKEWSVSNVLKEYLKLATKL